LEGAEHFILTTAVSSFARAQKILEKTFGGTELEDGVK